MVGVWKPWGLRVDWTHNFTTNSIADDKKVTVFLSVIRGKRIFPTAGLTSPRKALGQVATSVVPKVEGALQTQAVSHHRKI